MQVKETGLDGMLLITPDVFGDDRGWFLETYRVNRYAASGISTAFVQDNVSYSERLVLRGLHFQYPHGQAKLVHVLEGELFDVGVDVRAGSPNFGRWYGARLNSETKQQLFVPEGFAHGFVVLSENALFAYKCSEIYHPESEKTILWNDSDIAIDWPLSEPPRLSEKDANALPLGSFSPEELPRYEASR